MGQSIDDPAIIAKQFVKAGKLLEISYLEQGHINDTYISKWQQGSKEVRYVHQRINHKVFLNVPEVMENIARITSHIKSKLQAVTEEQTLNVLPSLEGKTYYLDQASNYWRTYDYIENAKSFEVCPDSAHAYAAARAFGRFIMYLSDMAPRSLHEPISRFQDSDYRYKNFEKARKENMAGRAAQVGAEIDFVVARSKTLSLISAGLKSGHIPLRVTHSDPKINNVLFSKQTGEALCVVDLDACMAGTVLYDFGDMVRTGCATAEEDEIDLSKVQINLEFFDSFSKGYLESIKQLLTQDEISLFSSAPALITLVMGIRFLTDYLNGDKYYKINFSDHNLRRAHTQFALVESMEKNATKMEQIVKKHLAKT